MEDWISEHLSAGLGQTVGRNLASDAIAQDLQIDPFDGLKAYTAGNGLSTRKRFDIARRLTELSTDTLGTQTYRYGNRAMPDQGHCTNVCRQVQAHNDPLKWWL